MEIKGTALLTIRDFVRTNHADQYLTWLNALNEEARSCYGSVIDSTSWYPVEVFAVEPIHKISELFYDKDTQKVAWEGGRFSAEKALKGIYKIFVKASSPHFIISRASYIFERYYRPCKMEVVKNENHRVVLNMTDAEQSDEYIECRIAGWMQKALEISGCKNVQVEISQSMARGDKITEFISTWD